MDGHGNSLPTSSNYTPPRVSTSHQSNLSTGISGFNKPTGEASLYDEPVAAAPSFTQAATIEQSVRLFKIFEALRHGDTTALSKILQSDGEANLEGTTVLHLAVQCADQYTIEYVLAQHAQDVNAKDKDGNTALHIAAQLGRAPVVKVLLEQPGVNDSITNYTGKAALDLARNPDIFQTLQLSRSVYIDQIVRTIHSLVSKSDYDGLERLLADSRVRATMDVNAPELATEPTTIETGGALLHEAARKHDLKLAQILLLNGADPFRRDRKGKLPQDVTKDEKTRAILKKSPAAAVAQRSIQEKSILGDSSVSLPSSDGPGGKESREMKGYLRKWTNYTSGFKLRWFVLEDGVLSYYKNQEDAGSACRGAINMKIARLKMDPKDKLVFEILGKSSVKYNLKANHEVEAKRWFWALNNAIQWSKDEEKTELKRQQQHSTSLDQARHEQLERQRTREADVAQQNAHLVPATAVGLAGSASGNETGSIYEQSIAGDMAGSTRGLSRAGTIEGDVDDDEEYGDDLSAREARPVNRDAFSITAQSAKLQLELLEQISVALRNEGAKQPNMTISDKTVVQALGSYETAVGNLKGLLLDLLRISKDHEAYWQARLEREVNVRRLWEDSMARVAKEQEELESRIGESEYKRKQAKRALREVLDTQVETADSPELVASPGPVEAGVARRGTIDLSPEAVRRRRETIASITKRDIFDDDEEDEEEFFDAVDAGEVEVVAAMPPTSPSVAPADEKKAPIVLVEEQPVTESSLAQDITKSFKGYEDGIRKRLKLDADNRPKVSLWGILKSMIGKDMTKMTLPVTFNEPTSLLYRVVEDMEYTDLLNVAALRADSMERLVYVAAFAASEYASTIGRVAKPFNPLLGETYEYVRPDLGYRFFIEQVTHHPPVGAAYAESKYWDYYGESAVKSKFYGKSFEFNPLGTWFLKLRPESGGEELYTWKKVTSSVIGIITGNPTVDNYGPMEIKNWTTGEVCYLDFKPKGWKASSAFQVSGKAVAKNGKTVWSIGGRWNDKIYARLTPGYEVELSSGAAASDKAILVWEAHERPTGIPFNVTPFVVTLNDLPDRLRPYIAPTDSRLRPDQRAMEEGEYDFAADEKVRLEEAQRARRRVREAKGDEFEPHWFAKAKHPITGEDYWDFNHKYWKVRDDVATGKTTWDKQGLEQIYDSSISS
ncbi:hypothetical protein AMS68_001758 [Peltaster fructicola]|uniref:PH domain-containing protein n=1 Tax=Peltaster fructicola TaxID=286661 RepID=A0A6H0XNL3_9PEZI|nr:hypothetical protein AMS68_001758 [Peltaster fructicola]